MRPWLSHVAQLAELFEKLSSHETYDVSGSSEGKMSDGDQLTEFEKQEMKEMAETILENMRTQGGVRLADAEWHSLKATAVTAATRL